MTTATYNAGDGPNRLRVRDLNDLRKRGVTVIGCQEWSDRRAVTAEFLDQNPGWRVWSPSAPGAEAVPIFYDSRVWEVMRLRSVLGVAARWVGAGAGPSRAKAKRINVVALRQRDHDGNRRRFINTHFIASATRQPAGKYRLRRSHYEQHARALARVIGRGRRMRRTTVTGDFNAPPNHELLNPVHATGIEGWQYLGTHGSRPIDQVLGPKGKRRIVETASDHKAVVGP